MALQCRVVQATCQYYKEHRKDFSKETRERFIEQALAYVDTFTLDTLFNPVGSLEEGRYEVKVEGENPVPPEATDYFEWVRTLYIEDGATFTVDDRLFDIYSEHVIACTHEDLAQMLKTIWADRALLGQKAFDNHPEIDRLLDVSFTQREETLSKARDHVYPVIVVHDFEELKSLENSDLWKAEVLLVPDEVVYRNDDQ